MNRLTERQRMQWHTGTRKQATAVQALVHAGAVRCDTCESPAVALGHQGEGSRATVDCGPCFLARLKVDRANRPSRAELVARVNTATGRRLA